MWERSAKVGWGRARGTHAGIQGARKVPIREDERRDDPLSRVVRIAEDRISQEFQVISKPVGVRREREDLWERLSSWSRIDASGVCVRRNGRFYADWFTQSNPITSFGILAEKDILHLRIRSWLFLRMRRIFQWYFMEIEFRNDLHPRF